MENKENVLSKNAIKIAIFLLTIGLLTILLFGLFKPFNDWSFIPNSELFGQYGDFIGGFVGTIFSLVAILLLYKTLIAQQNSIEKQDEAITIQRSAFEIELFETTFFNLLKTQQELTDGIKAYFHSLNDNFATVTTTVLGREFFAYSKPELRKIWLSIESENYLGTFDDDEDYLMYVNQKIDEYYNPNSPNYYHPNDAKIEENRIRNNERLRYVNKFYQITKVRWTEIKYLPVNKRIEAVYGLYFQRYHYAIGHYFRHLYHIIKFAKEFKPAIEQHKDINKKYIDFIQAQMSSFEMMLLFYNALAFPKLLDLLIEFNFLENLAEEDLVDISHNNIDGIKLKNRMDLLGFKK